MKLIKATSRVCVSSRHQFRVRASVPGCATVSRTTPAPAHLTRRGLRPAAWVAAAMAEEEAGADGEEEEGEEEEEESEGRPQERMVLDEDSPPPDAATLRARMMLPRISTPTPLLTPEKVFDRLHNAVHAIADNRFGAFYSSELGGVVTEPAFMFLPMDDHMVHRGHAVFDNVQITDGFLYMLPEHVRRLRANAEKVGIKILHSEEAIMRIILDTAAASKKINGTVRFWVTAGRGGFGLTPSECKQPGLYAIAADDVVELDRLDGWTAHSSPVGPQNPSTAVLKTTNYLINVIAQLQAEGRGFDVALFTDADGNVLGTPNMSVGFISYQNVLVVPPSTASFQSSTLKRLIDLIPDEALKSPDDLAIDSIEIRNFDTREMFDAKEVFVVNAEQGVMSVVRVDGQPVGDGTVGITVLAMQALLERDMNPQQMVVIDGHMRVIESENHMVIPYGYVTGMRSQLI